MKSPAFLILLCAAVLALGSPAFSAGPQTARDMALTQSTRKGVSPVTPSGAMRYAEWLTGCLQRLEKNVPAMTASAELAARQYVQDDYRIAAAGETYFVSEARGRAGGLMGLESPGKNITSTDPQYKYIVLYGLREGKLPDDVKQIQALQQLERTVIGFGRPAVLQQAIDAGATFDAVVENQAAENGGLFQDANGQWVVATDPTANIAALWVWTAEFTAACTRLGKMPPFYQSIMAPGALERNQQIGAIKFHAQAPRPIPAGELAKAYLTAVRANFAQVCRDELADIRTTADMAVQARQQGRHVYTLMNGHALIAQLPCPHDPSYFAQINAGWTQIKKGTVIEKDDVIFCLGYDVLFRDPQTWGNFAENARTAGAKLIWSLTDYREEEIRAILPTELFINQYWKLGDAVVEIPDYDVKLFPPSGVITEAILWMLNAEVHTKLHPQPAG